jgi:hypothetical protein
MQLVARQEEVHLHQATRSTYEELDRRVVAPYVEGYR